jgi:hypothetical protein
MADSTVGERFEQLVEELVGEPGVSPPGEGRGFGSDTLRVANKTFAMVAYDHLVLKLPKARVDDLIATGIGGPFAMKARTMKEWVTVSDDADDDQWSSLAREAMAFVDPSR